MTVKIIQKEIASVVLATVYTLSLEYTWKIWACNKGREFCPLTGRVGWHDLLHFARAAYCWQQWNYCPMCMGVSDHSNTRFCSIYTSVVPRPEEVYMCNKWISMKRPNDVASYSSDRGILHTLMMSMVHDRLRCVCCLGNFWSLTHHIQSNTKIKLES